MTVIPGRYHDTFVSPKGPGDARPTALQIIKDENLIGKLTGKIAVVTGSSSGIGVETVRALHETGATVFAAARNEAKAQAVVNEIKSSSPDNKAPIHVVILDNESLASVRRGAEEILKRSNGKVNILINNAGVMATPQSKTKDGFEMQFGTNHLAHFLLFQILKPALLAASTPEFNSRVVNVASIGHARSTVVLDDLNFEKSPYDPWESYGRAKTANIWMANELDRRYGSQGLHALSLHPGGIETGLQKHVDSSTRAIMSTPEVLNYFKNTEQGAATQVYAAVSKEWEGRGGRYLSNCEEQGPVGNGGIDNGDGTRTGDDGYVKHTYDPEGETILWKESLKLVGIDEE